MPIVVQNLSHTYMGGGPFRADALKDISLSIADGEFVGLIGHTGCGKSTRVQHLNGLLKPTAGQVLVDGMDINAKDADRRKVRQLVGLVFQYPEHQLFEETVAKDVAFGPHNLGLDGEEVDRRVKDSLRLVGIDPEEYGPRSPFELSGGQKRRVAIAGVLAMRPKMLVLDEPTAGLDPAAREELLRLIQSLHREAGMTILMVTHNMDDIARVADRIVVMNAGSVVLCGTPREVFSHGPELSAWGLGVPEATQLIDALNAAGWDLPQGLFRLEELADAIAQRAKGGRHD